MKVVIVLTLIALIGFINPATAFKPPHLDSLKNRNFVEFSGVTYNFLDATTPWKLQSIGNSFRVSYTLRIKGPHSARLAYEGFGTRYPYPPYNTLPGIVIERVLNVYSLGYLYSLYENKFIGIRGVYEINYREGSEMLLMAYAFTEPRGDIVGMRDIGLSLGQRLEINPVWRIYLSAEAKYTYYAIRKRIGLHPFYQEYDNTSTQTISLYGGIGVKI